MMPNFNQQQMWKNGSTMTNTEFVSGSLDDRPTFSQDSYKAVSDTRKELLDQDISKGMFKYGPKNSAVASIVAGSSPMMKVGQVAGSSGGYQGSNNTVQMNSEIYSPLLLNQNLSLPRDKATINAWCRQHFSLNPIVQNAIDFHRLYPISKLNIKCANKKCEQFYSAMVEDLDLLNVCLDISQEFWLLGEAFPYADFDDITGNWSRIFLQNPDYIIVKKGMGSQNDILIKPDEQLKNIATSNKPADVAQRNKLPQHLIQTVRRGQNIPVEPFNISHILRKTDNSQVRGTGLPTSVFRQLMLMDLIRESEFVQYQDFINPLMIVKIGNAEHKATPETLEGYRNVFEQATYDKNYKLFTHVALTVEMINKGSAIYDTGAKYTQLVNEVYIGMLIPKVIIEGGGDVTYANAGVTLDALKQRYNTFRSMLATWLRHKIFAPIAEIHKFYEYKDGIKKLILPDIEWNHMSLFDSEKNIDTLKELCSGKGAEKKVSLQTFYRTLGLDYAEENRKIRQEMIQTEILNKEQAALGKMSLEKLRTLSDDDEIVEELGLNVDDALPGTDSGGASGGSLLSSPPSSDMSSGSPPPEPPPPTTPSEPSK